MTLTLAQTISIVSSCLLTLFVSSTATDDCMYIDSPYWEIPSDINSSRSSDGMSGPIPINFCDFKFDEDDASFEGTYFFCSPSGSEVYVAGYFTEDCAGDPAYVSRVYDHHGYSCAGGPCDIVRLQITAAVANVSACDPVPSNGYFTMTAVNGVCGSGEGDGSGSVRITCDGTTVTYTTYDTPDCTLDPTQNTALTLDGAGNTGCNVHSENGENRTMHITLLGCGSVAPTNNGPANTCSYVKNPSFSYEYSYYDSGSGSYSTYTDHRTNDGVKVFGVCEAELKYNSWTDSYCMMENNRSNATNSSSDDSDCLRDESYFESKIYACDHTIQQAFVYYYNHSHSCGFNGDGCDAPDYWAMIDTHDGFVCNHEAGNCDYVHVRMSKVENETNCKFNSDEFDSFISAVDMCWENDNKSNIITCNETDNTFNYRSYSSVDCTGDVAQSFAALDGSCLQTENLAFFQYRQCRNTILVPELVRPSCKFVDNPRYFASAEASCAMYMGMNSANFSSPGSGIGMDYYDGYDSNGYYDNRNRDCFESQHGYAPIGYCHTQADNGELQSVYFVCGPNDASVFAAVYFGDTCDATANPDIFTHVYSDYFACKAVDFCGTDLFRVTASKASEGSCVMNASEYESMFLFGGYCLGENDRGGSSMASCNGNAISYSRYDTPDCTSTEEPVFESMASPFCSADAGDNGELMYIASADCGAVTRDGLTANGACSYIINPVFANMDGDNDTDANKGGLPFGVCVSEGEVTDYCDEDGNPCGHYNGSNMTVDDNNNEMNFTSRMLFCDESIQLAMYAEWDNFGCSGRPSYATFVESFDEFRCTESAASCPYLKIRVSEATADTCVFNASEWKEMVFVTNKCWDENDYDDDTNMWTQTSYIAQCFGDEVLYTEYTGFGCTGATSEVIRATSGTCTMTGNRTSFIQVLECTSVTPLPDDMATTTEVPAGGTTTEVPVVDSTTAEALPTTTEYEPPTDAACIIECAAKFGDAVGAGLLDIENLNLIPFSETCVMCCAAVVNRPAIPTGKSKCMMIAAKLASPPVLQMSDIKFCYNCICGELFENGANGTNDTCTLPIELETDEPAAATSLLHYSTSLFVFFISVTCAAALYA